MVRGIVLLGGLLALAAPQTAWAACSGIAISTPQQLAQISANLSGAYCLKKDIDLSTVANFKSIGSFAAPFTGVFDGDGHTIRHLTIHSGQSAVGLFGAIGGGTVRNVVLAGVEVRSGSVNASVGGVVGYLLSGTISGVSVRGAVRCSGQGCRIGGIAGETSGQVDTSSSMANVTGGNGGAAGGVAGQSNGPLISVYATGQVKCGSNCASGGLVGHSNASIVRSFAAGSVIAGSDGVTGGLVGTNNGPISYAYATGAARAADQDVGGLVGYNGGPLKQVFAAVRVTSGGGLARGLVAALATSDPADNAYWDTRVSKTSASALGTGLRTKDLLKKPPGFGNGWSVTELVSYPFMKNGPDFKSTLATLRHGGSLYTFVPLNQREPAEYAVTPQRQARASLAAVYAMVARGIGLTKRIAALRDVAIDTDFWDDGSATAQWTGPVTNHATLGSSQAIMGAINDTNVIGPLRNGQLVAVGGTYSVNGTTRQHWMLATSFTYDSTGSNLDSVVANDPWTGNQVRIDPITRQVTTPGFPLNGYAVDTYAVISLN